MCGLSMRKGEVGARGEAAQEMFGPPANVGMCVSIGRTVPDYEIFVYRISKDLRLLRRWECLSVRYRVNGERCKRQWQTCHGRYKTATLPAPKS